MKSSTRLDSVVFQLTPTRTRFELVVYANGRTEKVASGLLSPFLAHLKTAKDQIAKGGYSVVLEPEPGSDAWWFTKETLERFVRFVSTPEILERVHTLESEIMQMEKTITIHRKNDVKLHTVENQLTFKENIKDGLKGKKTPTDFDADKSIVLYTPDSHLSESNGLTAEEENPKVQLTKLLETRRNLLQKEQEMAFARAVAAGFDIDNLSSLMSFAEKFGALRLMDACVRFKKLWEKKHETGQLIKIEATSSQPDLTDTNTSGISHSTTINQQWVETPENNGKAEYKAPVDQKIPPGNHEYFKGHFPRPMFPPWPMHSQPGSATMFQAYSGHCIPYYQIYPETSSSTQPMYISSNIFTHSDGQRNSNGIETDTWDGYKMRINSAYNEELDKETSGSREPGEKDSQVGNNQSVLGGSQVWELEDASHCITKSASGCKFEDDDGDPTAYKNHRKSSKGKGGTKIQDKITSSMKEGAYYNEADGGHWEAFQSLLLKGVKEAEFAVSKGTFSGEKDGQGRRCQSMEGNDPKGGQSPKGRRSDIGLAEMCARRDAYRRTTNDGFIVDRQEHSTSASLDPMDVTEPQLSNYDNRRSLHDMVDDSCIISSSLGQTRIDGRNVVDMDLEFRTTVESAENLANRARVKARYEPDDLNLIPERNTGKDGYDPMLQYCPQLHMEAVASFDKKGKEGETDRKASKMLELKSKLAPDNSHKKKTVVPKRKGGAPKVNPSEEARARAEKLRAFKADLQKIRKEKEEEQIKRLEALRVERQKRIAARSTAASADSATSQVRRQMPSKLSPSSYNRSKFSDSEPGPVSPLQRIPIRIVSSPSSDPIKASKSSKSNASSPSGGNKLSRSVSSFRESKTYNRNVTTDTKVAVALLRRLSEPTVSSHHRDSQPLPSESRKHLPIKALPVSHKGSKFSDSEPVCLLPIRKFPIRTVSAESVGSVEASNSSKLNTRSYSTGKLMSHSAPTFPKKGISYLPTDTKASASHIRRLPEPKICSSQLVSPVTPHSAPPLRKKDISNLTADKKASTSQIRRLSSEPKIGSSQFVSSVKKHKAEPVTKPIFSGGHQSKKISAIVNHDKIKTSTFQALKIRTTKMPEAAQAKLTGKEVPLTLDKGKTVIASESDEPKRNSGKVLHDGDENDNMVAEKTIMMVECEKPSAATGETSAHATLGLRKDILEPVMDNRGGCALVSTETIKQEQSNASEASAGDRTDIGKGSPKHSSAFRSPILPLLNLEDERTENLNDGEALSTNFTTSTTGTRTLRSHLSEPESLNLETIPEASNKNSVKESSKGFRRLLRFRKKSHSKGEHKCESDNSSANSDGPRNSACSGEVCTLKNLLSQDETVAAVSTPQKASRHFSLLSPFRNKNRIKKETL